MHLKGFGADPTQCHCVHMSASESISVGWHHFYDSTQSNEHGLPDQG